MLVDAQGFRRSCRDPARWVSLYPAAASVPGPLSWGWAQPPLCGAPQPPVQGMCTLCPEQGAVFIFLFNSGQEVRVSTVIFLCNQPSAPWKNTYFSSKRIKDMTRLPKD